MTAPVYGMVLTTLPSEDDALHMAGLLIDDKLAACVQIMPVTSIYCWQGARTRSSEFLLLIKTRMNLQDRVTERIRTVHSYDIPEIVTVPFTDGLPAYLKWIASETAGSDSVTSSRPPGP